MKANQTFIQEKLRKFKDQAAKNEQDETFKFNCEGLWKYGDKATRETLYEKMHPMIYLKQ